MDAYSKEPHRQFIGAEDDRALQYFLKAWGPLWIGLGDQTGDWTGKCSMVLVRRERDELIAWTRLFTALENPGGPGSSDDPIQIAITLLRLNPDRLSMAIRLRLGLPVDAEAGLTAELETRLLNASKLEVANLCGEIVRMFPTPVFGNSLTVHRTPTGSRVRATIGFHNLLDALYWMVWQDIFLEKPFWFCKRCTSLIFALKQQERRFCNDYCAKLYTDKKWKEMKRKDPAWRLKEQDRRRFLEGRKARVPSKKSADSGLVVRTKKRSK